MHHRIFKKALLAALTLFFASASVAQTASPALAEDKNAKKEDSVTSVTDASFNKEVLKSDKPVLVDFWAPWCGPCRLQGPIVEEVSDSLGSKAKVVKLNTDENQKTAQAYNINGIPALIIFKKGKVVEQKVGLTQKDELLSIINKHL